MSADTVPAGEAPPGPTERDPRPVVAPPRQGLPGAAIAAFALALAVILFLVLDARRRAATVVPREAGSQANGFAAPPPLAIPPEPEPAPAPVMIVTSPAPQPLAPSFRMSDPAPAPEPLIVPLLPSQPVVAPSTEPPKRPVPRLTEPALVIDTGAGGTGASFTGSVGPNVAGGQPQGAATGAGDDAPVRATAIRNRTTIMPVGTLIPAVLETPIDTARPGLVRAVVSRDTRGFDGRRVLVPRGSRLIGEYQADVRSGQDRVLVTWTRLIRPDGVAIRLGSPAADAMGGAGVPGRVNTFFFQRFASAVLQSALTIGVNLASRPRSGSVIVGLPTGPITTVGQGLLPANDLRPKITVRQGAALNVFVARDLDFSGTGGRPR